MKNIINWENIIKIALVGGFVWLAISSIKSDKFHAGFAEGVECVSVRLQEDENFAAMITDACGDDPCFDLLVENSENKDETTAKYTECMLSQRNIDYIACKEKQPVISQVTLNKYMEECLDFSHEARRP